jgi:hypothetical protein
MCKETVTGAQTKLLLYDSLADVWFLPMKHFFPARWIIIFYELFTERSFVFSNIKKFRGCS